MLKGEGDTKISSRKDIVRLAVRYLHESIPVKTLGVVYDQEVLTRSIIYIVSYYLK